jgi:hypothetical protein
MSKIWLPRWGIYGCECMRDSLPHIESDMIAHKIIHTKLDWYQGGYHKGTTASAGTHDGGGVGDTAQYSSAAGAIWKKWGVLWYYRHPPLFSYHGHLAWVGCPHGAAPLKQQVAGALHSGWNGLAGRSAAYGEWFRVPALTWQQAVKKYAKPAPPKPSAPKGLLGMTSEIGPFNATKAQPLPNGKPVHLRINDKPSRHTIIGTRAAQAVATAAIRVTGLKAGERVDLDWQLIYVFVKGGRPDISRVLRYGSSVTFGKPGTEITWSGGVPASDKKGYDLRLRLRATAHAKAAVVTAVQVRGLR